MDISVSCFALWRVNKPSSSWWSNVSHITCWSGRWRPIRIVACLEHVCTSIMELHVGHLAVARLVTSVRWPSHFLQRCIMVRLSTMSMCGTAIVSWPRSLTTSSSGGRNFSSVCVNVLVGVVVRYFVSWNTFTRRWIKSYAWPLWSSTASPHSVSLTDPEKK